MAATNTTEAFFQLITADEYNPILLSFVMVWLVITLCGTSANLVNLLTFYTMGLQDGVIMSFFTMSFSDLMVTAIYMVYSFSVVLRIMEIKQISYFGVDPFMITRFAFHLRELFYFISVLITTVLAFVRCLAVAMPLRFRNTVTKFRMTGILTCIHVYTFTAYLPLLLALRIVHVRGINSTVIRYTMGYNDVLYVAAYNYIEVSSNIVLNISAEILVIICLVVMAGNLRMSSQFRKSAGTFLGTEITAREKLPGKELQVVKQVALVSTVFVVCNSFKILIGVLRFSVPGYNEQERYHYVLFTTLCVRSTFEIVSSSVNIIIYYMYNAKYKAACPLGHLFLCHSRLKDKGTDEDQVQG